MKKEERQKDGNRCGHYDGGVYSPQHNNGRDVFQTKTENDGFFESYLLIPILCTEFFSSSSFVLFSLNMAYSARLMHSVNK